MFLIFGQWKTHETDPIDGFHFCPDLAMAAMKVPRTHHSHLCWCEVADPEGENYPRCEYYVKRKTKSVP